MFTTKDQDVVIRFSPKYELLTSFYILILPDDYSRLSKSIWSNEIGQWRKEAKERLGKEKLDVISDIIPISYPSMEWRLCLLLKDCENVPEIDAMSQHINDMSDFYLLNLLFDVSALMIERIRSHSYGMQLYEKTYGKDVAWCIENWVLNTKRCRDSLVTTLREYWTLEFAGYYFRIVAPQLTERGRKQIEDIDSVGLRRMENLLGLVGTFRNIIFSPTFFLKMSVMSIEEKEGTVIICPSEWNGESFIWAVIYEILSSSLDKIIVHTSETRVISYLDDLKRDKDVFQEYVALEDCIKLSWGWKGWVAHWFKEAYIKYACVKAGLAKLESIKDSTRTSLEKKLLNSMMLSCKDRLDPTQCFFELVANA